MPCAIGEGGAAQSISTPGARIAPSDGDAPHRGFCCHFGISWTFGSWDECRAPQGCLVCWAGCKMPESDLAGLDSLTCVWESNATTSECDVVARPYRFRRFNPTDVVGVVCRRDAAPPHALEINDGIDITPCALWSHGLASMPRPSRLQQGVIRSMEA